MSKRRHRIWHISKRPWAPNAYLGILVDSSFLLTTSWRRRRRRRQRWRRHHKDDRAHINVVSSRICAACCYVHAYISSRRGFVAMSRVVWRQSRSERARDMARRGETWSDGGAALSLSIIFPRYRTASRLRSHRTDCERLVQLPRPCVSLPFIFMNNNAFDRYITIYRGFELSQRWCILNGVLTLGDIFGERASIVSSAFFARYT